MIEVNTGLDDEFVEVDPGPYSSALELVCCLVDERDPAWYHAWCERDGTEAELLERYLAIIGKK